MTLTHFDRALKFVGVMPLIVLTLAAACAGSRPKIALSREKVAEGGVVEILGTGFAPKSAVLSYLKRPDGPEFTPLRLITDESGKFAHKIETSTLDLGKHEVWVRDSRGISSNVVTFEVVHEQAK